MPQGQPSFAKFAPPKRERYLKALATGARRGAAAKSIGVSLQLVRMFRNCHPEFALAELKAEDSANELVESALFNAACKGNVVAIQVWLYNRMPERWRDKRNIEVRAATSEPVVEPAVDTNELSLDELRVLSKLKNRIAQRN